MNRMIDRTDFYGHPAPDHVPPELLRRIDIFHDPVLSTDPFALIRRLREEPPIVYNLHNPLRGQSWLVTRASGIRQVASNPDLFVAAEQTGFSQLSGESWRMCPIEVDPPEHGKFRKLMNPWVSPPVVAALSRKVLDRATELIDPLVDRDGCEFMQAFAIPFPMTIFLDLFGLRHDDLSIWLEWVGKLLHAGDPAVSAEGATQISALLKGLLAERRGRAGDDMLTKIANAAIDGEPLSDGDQLGAAYNLFTGGLDTVTAMLGFQFWHLARNPALQQQLRERPEDIPKAIEEFLRFNSPVHFSRMATRDTELEGVAIRKGDWVTVLTGLGSLDQDEFPNADVIDVERPGNRHFAFGFGNHFCMGSHLARRELKIALEEWFRRIPPFRLASPDAVPTRGGFIFGVEKLDLIW